MKQGKIISINGITGSANMFSTDEMLAIYMSLHTSKELANEFLSQYNLKNVSREEKEEIDDTKFVLKNIITAMDKIEKTFESLGMKLDDLDLL